MIRKIIWISQGGNSEVYVFKNQNRQNNNTANRTWPLQEESELHTTDSSFYWEQEWMARNDD